ncbi:MAG: PmoA family protein [Promethearchaeota archaeon]
MKNFELVVLAGENDRPCGPLKVKIPFGVDSETDVVLSGEIDENEEVKLIGHISPINKKESELAIIVPKLKKRSELELALTNSSEDQILKESSKVEILPGSGRENLYEIKINGKLFSELHFNEGDLANRPYLYPLLTPNGIRTTRSLHYDRLEGETKDHPHHTSCWVAWGDVNGSDNWAYGKNKGRQEVKSINVAQNSVYGKIDMDLEWITKRGKPQLKEHRQIYVYNMPNSSNSCNCHIVDFQIELQPIDKDVKFGDTKEGGFLSVRVATPMDVPKGGKIENAIGGINEKSTWGKRAQWCDYSGIVDGNKVGIAILDHHDNTNFPTYWHVRNYGLMAANPFGISYFRGKKYDGSYLLRKGDSLVFRYRLIVHDGDASEANIKMHYLNYYVPWEYHVF